MMIFCYKTNVLLNLRGISMRNFYNAMNAYLKNGCFQYPIQKRKVMTKK